MSFYLVRWVGDGSPLNLYRPDVDGDTWAAIDLRGDSRQQEGWALVRTDGTARGHKLGDDARGRSRAARNLLRSQLGVDLVGESVAEATTELLTLWGTPPHDKTRWNRLKQNRFGRHRIIIGGEVLYDAPAVVGVTITDTFDRSDSDSLGTSSQGTWSWTELGTGGDIDIVSNKASVAVANVNSWGRAEIDLASDDQYVQANVENIANNNSASGLMVRFSSSAITGYAGNPRRSGSTNSIVKYVAASGTSLATVASTIADNSLCRFEVDGSALELFDDGVSVLSTTDTDITGNLRTGLIGFAGGGANRARWDNFEAGDLATAPQLLADLATEDDTAYEAELLTEPALAADVAAETDRAYEAALEAEPVLVADVAAEVDRAFEALFQTEPALLADLAVEDDRAYEATLQVDAPPDEPQLFADLAAEADRAYEAELQTDPQLVADLAREADRAYEATLRAGDVPVLAPIECETSSPTATCSISTPTIVCS